MDPDGGWAGRAAAHRRPRRGGGHGLGLVIGMVLLEVVLLAGPAFAVGAKRQERVLALLAATGAERRDLRRTVLAGGLVLGVLGALVGVVAGTATAAAALTVLPRWTTEVPGPLEVRPLELLAVAGLGAATALAAALLPAVLAALTGRRGVRRASLRVPLIGLVAAAAGGAIALEGRALAQRQHGAGWSRAGRAEARRDHPCGRGAGRTARGAAAGGSPARAARRRPSPHPDLTRRRRCWPRSPGRSACPRTSAAWSATPRRTTCRWRGRGP